MQKSPSDTDEGQKNNPYATHSMGNQFDSANPTPSGRRIQVKKRLDICGMLDEDNTIYENIQTQDKKMSYKDSHNIINVLNSHFFFSNLGEEEIEMIISKMFYATVNKNEFVFKQNDRASCFFILW